MEHELTAQMVRRLKEATRQGYLLHRQGEARLRDLFLSWAKSARVPAILVRRHGRTGKSAELEIDSTEPLSEASRAEMSRTILDADIWMPNRIPAVNDTYTFVRHLPWSRARQLAKELFDIGRFDR